MIPTPPTHPAIARAVAGLPDDLAERFHERAAIREYDGGMERGEAESAALADVLEMENRGKR